jgi:hypothetical protein
LFALGLFNASLFAASILPLSTAYTVCEGLGFESGVERKFSEAPAFYWLYTVLIVAGGAVILIPGLPYIKIAVFSQVVNGAVLPFVLIFMLLLINKKELMGEYVNKPTFNIIAWATTAIMIVLTALLALWSPGPRRGGIVQSINAEIAECAEKLKKTGVSPRTPRSPGLKAPPLIGSFPPPDRSPVPGRLPENPVPAVPAVSPSEFREKFGSRFLPGSGALRRTAVPPTRPRVLMNDARDFHADLRHDPQFFLQFPAHGIARLFAFFDFASREIPISAA